MKLKSILQLLVIITSFHSTNAQILKQWADTNSIAGDLTPSKIRISGQGNVYTLASLFDNGNWSAILIQRINSNGTVVWEDTLQRPGIYGKDLQLDASGNVYAFAEEGGTGDKAWVVKYSATGVRKWVYDTHTDFYSAPARIRIDNAGNVIIGYSSRDSILCFDPVTQLNYYRTPIGIKFIKLNSSGNVIMNFNFQDQECTGVNSDNTILNISPFDIDLSGNIYCSYVTANATTAIMKYNVMKINTSGSIDWNNTYYFGNYQLTAFTVYNLELKYDPVSQHILTVIGILTNGSSTVIVPYLTAIDNSGNQLWNLFDAGGPGGGRLETDGNGNIFWGYYNFSGSSSSYNIKKISPAGNLLWTALPPGTVPVDGNYLYYEGSPGFRVDSTGNLYVFEQNPNSSSTFRMYKYSSVGSIVWHYDNIDNIYASVYFNVDNNLNLYFSEQNRVMKYIPCPVPNMPASIVNSGGIAKVCPGETRTYTTSNAGGFTFNWTVPTGASITSGQGTNSINVTYDIGFITAGVISVVKISNCGTSAPRNLTVNRNNVSATITQNGPTTFCAGTNQLTLTANAGTGYSYQWKKGSVDIAGATGQSYLPTGTSSGYRVVVTNSAGCSQTSAKVAVTVNPLPAATVTPLGPTTFCAGDSSVLQANTGAGLSYQWKKGTSLISGATQQLYTSKIAGSYKVIVTNSNNCSRTSAPVVVTVNCRLSDETADPIQHKIFPNPTHGLTTIAINSEKYLQTELLLIDATGRQVIKNQISLIEGNNEITFDMSDLANGIYLLRIKLPDGNLSTRIIKN